MTVVLLSLVLIACSSPPREPAEETVRMASLDSAAALGRNLLWRAHACMQRAQAARTDTTYPASDSVLRLDPACRSLPFSTPGADGWQLAFRRTGDTAGYELRANRAAPSGRQISLFSRVLAREINADAATIHVREGDSLATWSDPVIGSPLPALVWIGWCLEQNQTTRDSGIEGYPLYLRPLGPESIGCLGTPPFQSTADSDVVIVSANGMEYAVRYEVGDLEPESLSSLGEDGEMHTILEWQYNTNYSLSATPVRYGETGIRSYQLDKYGGSAQAWVTKDRPAAIAERRDAPIEVPLCDWLRGQRCAAPKPNPNDGSFGPGLNTILFPDQYKSH